MKIALDLFLTLLVLVAGFWIALFGSTGVILATRARFTKIQGFFVGSLLGPIGLIWLLIRGRNGSINPSISAGQVGSPADEDAPEQAPPLGGVDLNI